jgi:hypothetical protein
LSLVTGSACGEFADCASFHVVAKSRKDWTKLRSLQDAGLLAWTADVPIRGERIGAFGFCVSHPEHGALFG